MGSGDEGNVCQRATLVFVWGALGVAGGSVSSRSLSSRGILFLNIISTFTLIVIGFLAVCGCIVSGFGLLLFCGSPLVTHSRMSELGFKGRSIQHSFGVWVF